MNNTVDAMNGMRLPKTSAIWLKRGWSTADATMKELAIQTYSVTPPTDAMIVGRAVVIMTTSRTQRKEMTQRATKVPQNRRGRFEDG